MSIEILLIVTGLLLITGSRLLASLERSRVAARHPEIDAFVAKAEAFSMSARAILKSSAQR